jgi:hypothetical protein
LSIFAQNIINFKSIITMNTRIMLAAMAGLTLSIGGCTGSHTDNDATPNAEDCIPVKNSEYVNTTRKVLAATDTIAAFEKDYPVGVRAQENGYIIKFAKSDTVFAFVDKSGNELWRSGFVGNGPEDVKDPYFLMNCGYIAGDAVQLYDVNAGHMVNLNIADGQVVNTEVPSGLTRSKAVNIEGDKVVGQHVGTSIDEMFYVGSLQSPTIGVECPVKPSQKFLQELGGRTDYMFSTNAIADFSNGKIVVPFYFFDQYMVYDLNGKLLKTVDFDDAGLTIDAKLQNMMNSRKYSGYSTGIVSDNGIYLLRVQRDDADRSADKQEIVKLDKEGNPEIIYTLPSSLTNFTIGKDGEILALVSSAGPSSENEIFYLVELAPVTR